MQIGNYDYEIGRLNAIDQFHVSRKIAPIIPTIMPILTELAKGQLQKTIEKLESAEENDVSGLAEANLESLGEALQPLMDAFAKMPEDDVDYVIKKCLTVVSRNGAKVVVRDAIMFDDLGMEHILPLTIAVIRTNLGNFIQGLLTKALNTKQPT
ncbi:phage tail assembly chaperone [Acinetobacter baumannii]|uniref:phage tail assembly chaperone n=1 Tax=Acinetobacter baumannii TaxID=470 RepID=UPI0038B69ED9